LSPSLSRELASVSILRNRWVAVDTSPRPTPRPVAAPLHVALRSGAVVVDADAELDELCARLKAARQTSLMIVFNGARS
jgi:hypothetical protein